VRLSTRLRVSHSLIRILANAFWFGTQRVIEEGKNGIKAGMRKADKAVAGARSGVTGIGDKKAAETDRNRSGNELERKEERPCSRQD
jgi:hypothetical protein